MKQYPHIIAELFHKPLIITHARHAAMVQILEARIAGGSADRRAEIEANPISETEQNPEVQIFGQCAIIPIHGVVTRYASDIPASSCGCGLDEVSAMIEEAQSDRGVQTLLFDFRTPGGSVNGIPEMAAKIASSRKPTVAFTGSECCSAGVWLATQCQSFFCSPSASVGSIGVWSAYADLTKQMKKEGVAIQSISAGKYKLMGAYWKALTDEEKAMLQADVDRIYAQFKDAVNARRQVADEFMQGQIFDGEKACEIGLCDGLIDEIGELIED